MTAAALYDEMCAATARVRQPHIDRLLALGVPGKAIASLGSRELPFGISTIERMERGLYQPGDGPLHVLSPVYVGGEIIDIVAWRSDAPGNWAWRTGLGWALGADLLAPRWDSDPMPIYATPLEWLSHAGEGMCILDWESSELDEIRTFTSIEADDTIAARIVRALNKPRRVPNIIRRKAVRHAA